MLRRRSMAFAAGDLSPRGTGFLARIGAVIAAMLCVAAAGFTVATMLDYFSVEDDIPIFHDADPVSAEERAQAATIDDPEPQEFAVVAPNTLASPTPAEAAAPVTEATPEGTPASGVAEPEAEPTPAIPTTEPLVENIDPAFRAFWLRNGGVGVFGYPVSEPVDDEATGMRVQYFERHRMETFNTSQLPNYDVQLGMLGVESAEDRELQNHQAFAPVAENDKVSDDCLFIPQTQHFICGHFLDYWLATGSQYHESEDPATGAVYLLGYPISEQYRDPEWDVVVQYFERARLEFYPEEGEDGLVISARLGADQLHATIVQGD